VGNQIAFESARLKTVSRSNLMVEVIVRDGEPGCQKSCSGDFRGVIVCPEFL
jgi:hypothetical protein